MSWGAFLVSLLLGIIIPLASLILMETTPYSEKTKPYECGFNPIYQTGNPFSIRFFTVAILFLLFDLEVVIRVFQLNAASLSVESSAKQMTKSYRTSCHGISLIAINQTLLALCRNSPEIQ